MRIAIAALISASLLSGGRTETPSPEHRYLAHIQYLASEKLKGRATGSPEIDQAAEYIAHQFKLFGLRPVNGSYFQKFPVTTSAQLGHHNKLELRVEGHRTQLQQGVDYTPLNFSAAGEVNAPVIFAGYGITAPEYNYDDYAGLDVKDKIVVLLRREPQETDEKSPFQGRVYTRHAQFDSKAVNAKLRGAKAIVVLTDVLPNGYGDLEKFAATAGPPNAGIPFMMTKAELFEPLFQAAGHKLRETHDEIDKDLKPRSFAFPENFRIELKTDITREVRQARNVVGLLPGETNEFLIIGAHYDHLGLGEQFSMAPALAGRVHPGADDNASGTAGVLELARRFGAMGKMKRGILFIAFAGEELGLLGSGHYANNPLLPIDRTVAMLNMDMIGRAREGHYFISGSGTGNTLNVLLTEIPKPAELEFDFSETAGYGSSDHTSFTARQVPTLFFFSGLHSDYHKPSDTWDKIDAHHAVEMLDYIAAVAEHLASDTGRPKFVRVMPPASAHSEDHSAVAGSGYGPYFGSIPDFAEPPSGVRFADVRDGSPAAIAGLKAGDILISFDGKTVQNLMDFTVLLRQKSAGDTVAVEVLRSGETIATKVLLTVRK